MEWLSDPNAWIGLLTLSALEIVLGIDNIIFISILSGKLPAPDQPKARKLGLAGAFFTRVLLLLSIAWIIKLTRPLFSVLGHGVSGRDLILIAGGLFLIGWLIDIFTIPSQVRRANEEIRNLTRTAAGQGA